MENIFYNIYILKHADPLLGKDRKISKYTRAVGNGFAKKHVPKETTELQQRVVFSVWSVPRCYKRDKLGAADESVGEEKSVR
jgi:hypothetical protein